MAREAGQIRVVNALSARARQVLATALGLDPARLPDDAASGRTEEWDSLAHMRWVAAIEAELGRQISAEAIVSLASLGDVERVLAQAP